MTERHIFYEFHAKVDDLCLLNSLVLTLLMHYLPQTANIVGIVRGERVRKGCGGNEIPTTDHESCFWFCLCSTIDVVGSAGSATASKRLAPVKIKRMHPAAHWWPNSCLYLRFYYIIIPAFKNIKYNISYVKAGIGALEDSTSHPIPYHYLNMLYAYIVRYIWLFCTLFLIPKLEVHTLRRQGRHTSFARKQSANLQITLLLINYYKVIIQPFIL